jgi:hypothetical protein
MNKYIFGSIFYSLAKKSLSLKICKQIKHLMAVWEPVTVFTKLYMRTGRLIDKLKISFQVNIYKIRPPDLRMIIRLL